MSSLLEWTADSRRASAVVHPLAVEVWFAAVDAHRHLSMNDRYFANSIRSVKRLSSCAQSEAIKEMLVDSGQHLLHS
ncbi:hypothetical protein [Comamonas aquatica]|uniref:hypothetical protein n=1 Tax=Comamonas aquatica TaxID=225991 RepID=UPI0012EA9032|nr:hypothetical protein [Comamonas aquatica]